MPHVTEEIWSNLPTRKTRLMVAAWPTEDYGSLQDAHALDQVQAAAATFRRSGVLVQLADEERAIFEVVVKPERAKANGDAEAEIERLRKEIDRAEKMLANERFVDRAPKEVVAAEREKLDRLPAGARCAQRLSGSNR